jgi:hypothetical protein
MFLIDTNIFIEMLLDQKRANECQKLFELIHSGKVIAYVNSFTIHSIEVILERNKKLDMLESFLKDIDEAKGLKRFDTTTLEEKFAIALTKKFGIDFDDALQYYLCKTLNLKIVSFDKHFNKTDIKCLEPKDVLKKTK